jgi:hypothetical protein
LKEEALDYTKWSTCFGRCYGPLVRETKLCMMCVFVFWVLSTQMHLNDMLLEQLSHSKQRE